MLRRNYKDYPANVSHGNNRCRLWESYKNSHVQ